MDVEPQEAPALAASGLGSVEELVENLFISPTEGNRKIEKFIRTPRIIRHKLLELRQFSAAMILNLSICGYMGNGKTSFINSLQSFMEQRLRSPGVSINDKFTCTKCLSRFLLSPCIAIWDCPGEAHDPDKNLFHGGEYGLIDAGRIPDRFPFPDDQRTFGETFREDEEVPEHFRIAPSNQPLAKRMHARIWVLHASVAGDETVQRRVKEVYLKTTAKGRGPPFFIVLTGIDTIDRQSRLRHEPGDAYRSGALDKLMSSLSDATGLDRSKIFPVLNFVGGYEFYEDEEDHGAAEGLIARALSNIVNEAHEWVKSSREYPHSSSTRF